MNASYWVAIVLFLLSVVQLRFSIEISKNDAAVEAWGECQKFYDIKHNGPIFKGQRFENGRLVEDRE